MPTSLCTLIIVRLAHLLGPVFSVGSTRLCISVSGDLIRPRHCFPLVYQLGFILFISFCFHHFFVQLFVAPALCFVNVMHNVTYACIHVLFQQHV